MRQKNDLTTYASLSEQTAALSVENKLFFKPADFPEILADCTPFDGLVIDTSFIRTIEWTGEDNLPFEIMDQSPGFEGFAHPEGFRRVGLWLMHLLST